MVTRTMGVASRLLHVGSSGDQRLPFQSTLSGGVSIGRKRRELNKYRQKQPGRGKRCLGNRSEASFKPHFVAIRAQYKGRLTSARGGEKSSLRSLTISCQESQRVCVAAIHKSENGGGYHFTCKVTRIAKPKIGRRRRFPSRAGAQKEKSLRRYLIVEPNLEELKRQDG